MDEQLHEWDAHWSEGGVRLVWLRGQATFGEASDILAEVGHIHVSPSTVWRQAQQWGEALKVLEQQQAEKVQHLPSREEISPGEAKSTERLGVGMDGAQLYVLGEGWKEFTVGCVCQIVEPSTFVKEMLEWEEGGHAVPPTYVAHLGGPEVLGQKVWAEAHRRHWTQAWDTEVLGEGAPWIWNLADEHF